MGESVRFQFVILSAIVPARFSKLIFDFDLGGHRCSNSKSACSAGVFWVTDRNVLRWRVRICPRLGYPRTNGACLDRHDRYGLGERLRDGLKCDFNLAPVGEAPEAEADRRIRLFSG
jgi:hypothetical protein